MRTALVLSFGFLVGGIVGAFAVGTARGGDSSGEWIRVQIENLSTMPLTLRWPDYGGTPATYYGSSEPPAATMADRFTIGPGGGWCWFPVVRSRDRIDIQVKAVTGGDSRPVDAKELSGVKSLLVGWEKNAAVQRKDDSCVATGFEYLLRSAGALGIGYATFQDEFDLGALNDYPTVARAVERKYPDVRFAWSHFRNSEESMQFIERSIDGGRPIVLGLRLSPGSTHIVPVLGYDDKWVYYLNYAHADGTKDVRAIRRWELARRDQEWTTSTCQTAWLETRWPPGAYMEDKRDAAKSERRADPAAEEVIQRYASLVHYPATEGWTSVTGKGDADLLGNPYGPHGINPKWTPESGFGLDVTLSQSVKDQVSRTGVSEEWLAEYVLGLLKARGANTPFELPYGLQAENREHFNVTLRQDGDDQVVEMTPFDGKAGVDFRRYVFGKDGLLKNSSVEWTSSGTKLDLRWRFKKQGERYVIAWIHFSDRARGDGYGSKFDYYDGPNGSALLKEITFWNRVQGEGEVISFHDYVVDGKLVETTKAPPDGEGNPTETPPVPKADK